MQPIIDRLLGIYLVALWSKRFFDDRPGDWKEPISFKYNTAKPNILWAKPGNGSRFWKSVSWAFAAAKLFYKWEIGNGHCASFGSGSVVLKPSSGSCFQSVNNRMLLSRMFGMVLT